MAKIDDHLIQNSAYSAAHFKPPEIIHFIGGFLYIFHGFEDKANMGCDRMNSVIWF